MRNYAPAALPLIPNDTVTTVTCLNLLQDASYIQMSNEWKTALILSVILSSIQLIEILRLPSKLRMLQEQHKEQLLRQKQVNLRPYLQLI